MAGNAPPREFRLFRKSAAYVVEMYCFTIRFLSTTYVANVFIS